MDFKKLISSELVLFDGAMGTMLQKAGLTPGQCPETYNLTHPDIVGDIHESYLKAGSMAVYTNTFGASAKKLAHSDCTVEEIIKAAVSIASSRAKKYGAMVALDIGPLGELLEPMGTLSFESAYELFKQQMVCGEDAGADIIVIETMTDLYEAKASLLAAKENTSLPVVVTMSFEQGGRTFTGCSCRCMALTLQGLGADAIGINCSLAPDEILPIVKELLQYTAIPVAVKANAGLPDPATGEYSVSPAAFAQSMAEHLEAGVSIIGGCCGTSPEYIAQLKELIKGKKPASHEIITRSAVCSATKAVELDCVRVIGERINPTGKKLFKQALIDGNIDYIIGQGIAQVDAGADILDVNVGIPDIDEKAMMVSAVKALQGVVDTPLQIDSSDSGALEAALRIYNGKAIVNSVNGERAVLDRVLPIVKKYGAAVVGLTLDEKGIPKTAEERYNVAKRIVDAAAGYSIPREDVFIDCLTLTVSAEQQNAAQTLTAVRLVKERLGVNTVLGVSNISFGLPNRELLNSSFLTMAMHSGLTLPIINPNVRGMMDAIAAYNVLSAVDAGGAQYISRFAEVKQDEAKPAQDDLPVDYCIRNGLREKCALATKKLLQTIEPLTVVNDYLIPALDEVGRLYENGTLFLPQLIGSAETAKCAFAEVNAVIPKSERKDDKKIVLATVKGDIHDIGKNIVKVILENYGYSIIDLGRDVEIQAVVDAVKKSGAKMVGLSALMTTTIKSMEQTVKALRESGLPCTICVGGAVLTAEYAAKMGADYYAKDANETVAIAKMIFGS